MNRHEEGACIFCGELGDEDDYVDEDICSKCDDKGLGGDGAFDTFLAALEAVLNEEDDEEEEEE